MNREHFANRNVNYHQICSQFEALFHKPDTDNAIFALIQYHARNNFDALVIAQEKNKTLASYCQHNSLRAFWQALLQEDENVENDATVNAEY